MNELEQKLKELARNGGASLVGITTRERLSDGPPSADPTYLLPPAKSVISFAIALDPPTIRNYISKKDWLSHCEERKRVVQNLYTIGDRLAEFLKGKGYEAVNVDINNNYRPRKVSRT